MLILVLLKFALSSWVSQLWVPLSILFFTSRCENDEWNPVYTYLTVLGGTYM